MEYLCSILIPTVGYQRDVQVVSTRSLQLKNHLGFATDRGCLYLCYGTKDEIHLHVAAHRLKDGAIDLANHHLAKLVHIVASALAKMAAIKNYVVILGADGDKTAGWWVIPEVVYQWAVQLYGRHT